ncbi:hypothetical protein PRCDC_1003500 [Plasmodium reichenowi]|uniref:WD repeat-containing protein n=1 Tax=Plasmodium reichenowi TaxID=5854 RepID=A0A060RT55_PLARE|nr:hypothetical protein PRCDC_1003500 [Plasmodium reichenowi]
MSNIIKTISIFGSNKDIKNNIHLLGEKKLAYIHDNIVYIINIEKNDIYIYDIHSSPVYILRHSKLLNLSVTCNFNNYAQANYISIWDTYQYKEQDHIEIKNIFNYDCAYHIFNECEKKINIQQNEEKHNYILDICFVEELKCLLILTDDPYKSMSLWSLSNITKPYLCIHTNKSQLTNLSILFNYNNYKNKKSLHINKSIHLDELLEDLKIITYSSLEFYIWSFSFYLEVRINYSSPIYDNLCPCYMITCIYHICDDLFYVSTSNGKIYLFDKYIVIRYYDLFKYCILLIFLLNNQLICVLENGYIYKINKKDQNIISHKLNINTLIQFYYNTKFNVHINTIREQNIIRSEVFLETLLVLTNDYIILINLCSDEIIILYELIEGDIYMSTFLYTTNQYVVCVSSFIEGGEKSLIKIFNLDNTLGKIPLVVKGKLNCITSNHFKEEEYVKNYSFNLKKSCERVLNCNLRNRGKKKTIYILSIKNQIVFYEEVEYMLRPFYFISYSQDRFVTCLQFCKDKKYLFCACNDGSLYIYLIYEYNNPHFYSDHNIKNLQFKDMNKNYCISLYRVFRKRMERINKIKLLDVYKLILLVSSNNKMYLYNILENKIVHIDNNTNLFDLSHFQLYNSDDKEHTDFLMNILKNNIEEYVSFQNNKYHDKKKSSKYIHLTNILKNINYIYKILYFDKNQTCDNIITKDILTTDITYANEKKKNSHYITPKYMIYIFNKVVCIINGIRFEIIKKLKENNHYGNVKQKKIYQDNNLTSSCNKICTHINHMVTKNKYSNNNKNNDNNNKNKDNNNSNNDNNNSNNDNNNNNNDNNNNNNDNNNNNNDNNNKNNDNNNNNNDNNNNNKDNNNKNKDNNNKYNNNNNNNNDNNNNSNYNNISKIVHNQHKEDYKCNIFEKHLFKRTPIFYKDILYSEINYSGHILLCSFKNIILIYSLKKKNIHYPIQYNNISRGNKIKWEYETFRLITYKSNYTMNEEKYKYIDFSIVLRDIKKETPSNINSQTFNNLDTFEDNQKNNDINEKKENIKSTSNENNYITIAKEKQRDIGKVLFIYNDYLNFNYFKNNICINPQIKKTHLSNIFNSSNMFSVLTPLYSFNSSSTNKNKYKIKVPYAIDYISEKDVDENKNKNKNQNQNQNKNNNNNNNIKRQVCRSQYVENDINIINKNNSKDNTFYYTIVTSNRSYDIFVYIKGGCINKIEKTNRSSLKFICSTIDEDNVLEIGIPEKKVNFYDQRIVVQINSFHNTCYLSIPMKNDKI